jgi:hypothetical protein
MAQSAARYLGEVVTEMPPRRFASAYRHPVWGAVLGVVGLVLIVVGVAHWSTDTGDVIWGGLIGLLLVAWAIYLVRGRGRRPTVLPQPGPTQDELVWLDGVAHANALRVTLRPGT